MRIMIGTDTFLPMVNGIASHIHDLALEFVESGHEVTIIAPGHVALKTCSPRHRVLHVPSYATRRGNVAIPFRLHNEVKRIIEAYGADICHIHTPFIIGKAVLDVARNLNIPTVFTSHMRAENAT